MRVAVIGTGRWGKNHVRVLSQMGALYAVCDTDSKRCREFGETYSVKCYDSIDGLLESCEFDAAVIATPVTSHFEIAAKLTRAKKHVLVEKPATYTHADSDELVRLAERNKTVLACGYVERFNPAILHVKDLLDGGKCGELTKLEFRRNVAEPPRNTDVGVIHDVAVHDIDIANMLFGRMPSVVFARASSVRHEYEDTASIILGYGDGKTAMVSASWITPDNSRTLCATCTEAAITANYITRQVRVDGQERSEYSCDGREPLLLEMEKFLDAAEGKSIMEPRQATNVTGIAEAALLSSKKGVPIYLELK